MRVWALCAVEAGIDYLTALRGRVEISGIIGLSGNGDRASVSGYVAMAETARRLDCRLIEVDDYSLQDRAERDRLIEEPIDALLVCGWQRLVPPWLIDHCQGRVIGIHGSAAGIHGGRGRSPQNWALLLGADSFSISIFFVDQGIDSGDVIASTRFPLTDHDDIRSSYHKASLAVADLLVDALESGALRDRRAVAQPSEAFYLPRRVADDGLIDWTRSTREIHAFIRALTTPYPGAFSMLRDDKFFFWRARPFERRQPTADPGTVHAVFADGTFVITTGDGLLLVDEATSEGRDPAYNLSVGQRFRSGAFAEQIRDIIARHEARHPELPVSPSIREAAGESGPAND